VKEWPLTCEKRPFFRDDFLQRPATCKALARSSAHAPARRGRTLLHEPSVSQSLNWANVVRTRRFMEICVERRGSVALYKTKCLAGGRT
jgi:hypothetical protein